MNNKEPTIWERWASDPEPSILTKEEFLKHKKAAAKKRQIAAAKATSKPNTAKKSGAK